MSEDHKRHTYYWAIPIVLYLVTQSSVAVWWASTLNANVGQIQLDLTELSVEADQEELKIWSRIDNNKDQISRLSQQIASIVSSMSNVSDDIRELKNDLKENNRLLRELLSARSAPRVP